MAETVSRLFGAKLFSQDEFDEAQNHVTQLEQQLAYMNQAREADQARVLTLERERSEMMQRLNSLSELQLPINVALNDISGGILHGQDFNEHVDFCKQTIKDALATPQTFSENNGAKRAQVCDAVANRIGKKVNLVMFCDEDNMNGIFVYANSAIKLRVRGIYFLFFTPSRQ